MTDHRPGARAAIRGLIQLLTDRQPRRQTRDFIGDATPTPWREWREPGDCPDWLAVALGAAAIACLAVIVFYGFWSLSQ